MRVRALAVTVCLAMLVAVAAVTHASAIQLTPFRSESQAQRHCPDDVVVWLDFAKGILDVWKDFEEELTADTQLHQMAQACKEQAKQDARNVFDSVAHRAAKYTATAGTLMTKLF